MKQQVIQIVQEAGEILKKYFVSGDFTQRSKGGVDFATEADDGVDTFLRDELSKAFPQSQFLTEETAPKDFLSLKDAENLWVIDPIDGTVNFSRQNSECAISVALVQKGIPVVGIVYAPLQNKLYFADDQVDYALLEKTQIQISNTHDLTEALILCDWPWEPERRVRTYECINTLIHKVRAHEMRGSAALGIAAVADGSVDAYFSLGIHAWDIAAGILIVQKAGGMFTKIDGTPASIFDREVLISNGKLHEKLVALLQT